MGGIDSTIENEGVTKNIWVRFRTNEDEQRCFRDEQRCFKDEKRCFRDEQSLTSMYRAYRSQKKQLDFVTYVERNRVAC